MIRSIPLSLVCGSTCCFVLFDFSAWSILDGLLDFAVLVGLLGSVGLIGSTGLLGSVGLIGSTGFTGSVGSTGLLGSVGFVVPPSAGHLHDIDLFWH